VAIRPDGSTCPQGRKTRAAARPWIDATTAKELVRGLPPSLVSKGDRMTLDVLVVEDAVLVRRTVDQIIQEHGNTAAPAESSEEAFSHLCTPVGSA
jgi:hypothetical protein